MTDEILIKPAELGAKVGKTAATGTLTPQELAQLASEPAKTLEVGSPKYMYFVPGKNYKS